MAYKCKSCQHKYLKWQGSCTHCQEWGGLVEVRTTRSLVSKDDPKLVKGVVLQQIRPSSPNSQRFSLGLTEVDRVLGGGLLVGSLVLLGGQPGIGKSTLVLQGCHYLSQIKKDKHQVLYFSGEESLAQISARWQRLFPQAKQVTNFNFSDVTEVESIIATIKLKKPTLVVIDSIQTVYVSSISSEAGSVAQVRASCIQLLAAAKQLGVSIILIGHVTKEGSVAGPKMLEHLVDVVLYLETDLEGVYRLLRGVKNRFGSTNEIGVLEMKAQGLVDVADPAKVFLTKTSTQAGTVLSLIQEGSRVFLVEIQALVTKTNFGHPKRTVAGFDNTRVQILLAVLSKYAQLSLADYDVYINLVGGWQIKDPLLDLAVAAALISAKLNKPWSNQTVVCGEVGLGGEVRQSAKLNIRLQGAKSLGLKLLSGADIKNLQELRKHL